MKYDGHGSLKYFKNVSLGGSTFCNVYCLQRHLFQQGQTIFLSELFAQKIHATFPNHATKIYFKGNFRSKDSHLEWNYGRIHHDARWDFTAKKTVKKQQL